MTVVKEQPIRVLVVDDDPGRIEFVRRLRREDFLVDDAGSVVSAGERLKERAYDVVLLDMRMPDKNGIADDEAGLTVLREIGELEHEPTVIILTAFGTPKNTLAALELGAVAYLDKVKDYKDIGTRVREANQRRRIAIPDKELAFDVQAAREIQRRAFPDSLQIPTGLTVTGGNIPALHLSGDTFDFVDLGDKRLLYFLLCDVAGHGLSGALIAMHLHRVFRIGVRHNWSLQDMDRELHETALEVGSGERNATGIVGMVDVDKQRLQMLLAGHDLPTFYKRPGCLDPDLTGMPWGLDVPDRIAPALHDVPFHGGDSVVLCTDGITDMGIDDGNRFGQTRLQEAHDRFTEGSAKELCDHILYEALVHGRLLAASQDDLTVLAIHWRGQTPRSMSLPLHREVQHA